MLIMTLMLVILMCRCGFVFRLCLWCSFMLHPTSCGDLAADCTVYFWFSHVSCSMFPTHVFTRASDKIALATRRENATGQFMQFLRDVAEMQLDVEMQVDMSVHWKLYLKLGPTDLT